MSTQTGLEPTGPVDGEIEKFWSLACHRAKMTTLPGYLPSTSLEAVPPPAWAFGRSREQADRLLALVVDGTKTATASARSEYDAETSPLPQRGELSILLDGGGHPRALIETVDVDVRAFDEVDAEHAHLEGEGDRSLAHWRSVHEQFFADGVAGFSPDMDVVLERFRVVFAQ